MTPREESTTPVDAAPTPRATIAVIAKECRPGHVKTRLTPPFTPGQAATIAQAALDDSLEAVTTAARASGAHRVLYFDGAVIPHLAEGYEVVAQGTGGLDERLAHLFDAQADPLVLVGMDTPHMDPSLLQRLSNGWPDGVDAVFGPAADGGFWLLAMREPDGSLIRGVEMSLRTTGAAMRRRLVDAGLRVVDVRTLADVDTIEDASRVSALIPDSRFARAVNAALGQLGVSHLRRTRGGVRDEPAQRHTEPAAGSLHNPAAADMTGGHDAGGARS